MVCTVDCICMYVCVQVYAIVCFAQGSLPPLSSLSLTLSLMLSHIISLRRCDDAGSWRMAGCATARVVECFNADAVDDAEGDGSDNSAKIFGLQLK